MGVFRSVLALALEACCYGREAVDIYLSTCSLESFMNFSGLSTPSCMIADVAPREGFKIQFEYRKSFTNFVNCKRN
jgi:hypothetical protein